MSNFIRLSNRILNVSHIVEILKYTKKETPMFRICLNKSNYSGFAIFGSGGIDNQHHEIVISSKTDFEDYRRINDWIYQNNLTLWKLN